MIEVLEAAALPADMLVLLRRIDAFDPTLLENLDGRYRTAWQAGRELAEGRAVLQALAAYVVSQQRKQANVASTTHV